MNYIEEKIKEFWEKFEERFGVDALNRYEGYEANIAIKELLEDCQKRERERVVEMIEEEILHMLDIKDINDKNIMLAKLQKKTQLYTKQGVASEIVAGIK